MENLEGIAEQFEVTVDYLEDEFIIDGIFQPPSTYIYVGKAHIVVTDYNENAEHVI